MRVARSHVHVTADQYAGMLIRKGYVGKNPLSREYRQMVREDREYLDREVLPPERFCGRPIMGACAKGPAGMGKTKCFEMICASYPRSVQHYYESGEERYAFTQVPVLMIELHPDCSLKDLATEIFNKLGQAVGRDLIQEWQVATGSENSLQSTIYSVCREYHLGLIILDEVQNASSRGRKKSHPVQYLSRLMNSIGVPIIMIGTEGIGAMLESWLALGRRFTSGIPRFAPFEPGPYWEEFLCSVWKYRYVQEQSDPAEVSGLVLELTGGIPDLVIKLFMFTQVRLFGMGCEKIDAAALNETADQLFYLVKDRISELRTKKLPAEQGDLKSVLEAAARNGEKIQEEAQRKLQEKKAAEEPGAAAARAIIHRPEGEGLPGGKSGKSRPRLKGTGGNTQSADIVRQLAGRGALEET